MDKLKNFLAWFFSVLFVAAFIYFAIAKHFFTLVPILALILLSCPLFEKYVNTKFPYLEEYGNVKFMIIIIIITMLPFLDVAIYE